jgi:hypothetical protein
LSIGWSDAFRVRSGDPEGVVFSVATIFGLACAIYGHILARWVKSVPWFSGKIGESLGQNHCT